MPDSRVGTEAFSDGALGGSGTGLMTVSESNGHDGRTGRTAESTADILAPSRQCPVRSANILRVPSGSVRLQSQTLARHFRRVTKPRFIVAALSRIQQLHRCRDRRAETCVRCMLSSRQPGCILGQLLCCRPAVCCRDHLSPARSAHLPAAVWETTRLGSRPSGTRHISTRHTYST